MKTGWLLYDRGDFEVNRSFAAYMREQAEPLNLRLSVELTDDFENALIHPPDFVISRQRDYRISARLESMGIPVFNSARVCELCNDKRKTHAFLNGLPQMKTAFVNPGDTYAPADTVFPLVIKPAFGHGGDRVALAEDHTQLQAALSAISPEPALAQELAGGAGRDLRVYVLFGKIAAAVLRTASSGIVSNFKRGGIPALHVLSPDEKDLAEQVIRRFSDAGAPLSFAGIDLIEHHGRPVVNEVEDVVGSRMLYRVSDLDIIRLYITAIAQKLAHDNSDKL